MFKILYKSLIRPHVEYANCIWNPLLNKDMQLIEKVQRRATKIVPSLRDLTYEDRLRKLKLPTLAFRRLRGDQIQVYKIMHGGQTLFVMADQSLSTRGHSLKVRKQRARLKLRNHSFTMRVVNTWNSLPESTVCAKSMNTFKNGLDDALTKKFDKFTYGVGRLWQHSTY